LCILQYKHLFAEESFMGNLVTDSNRLWSGGAVPFELDDELFTYRPETDLKATVGVGGVNRPDDIQKVIKLLNSISDSDGGSANRLNSNNPNMPQLIAAIKRFQRENYLPEDGRIDPGKGAITEMQLGPTGNPYEARNLFLKAVKHWNSQLGDC